MKIDAIILLIHSYSTISMKVDKHINLADLARIAGLQDYILFAPKFFILKRERPLESNEDGILLAVRIPKKRISPIPESEMEGIQIVEGESR